LLIKIQNLLSLTDTKPFDITQPRPRSIPIPEPVSNIDIIIDRIHWTAWDAYTIDLRL